jgi:hypothetical protein
MIKRFTLLILLIMILSLIPCEKSNFVSGQSDIRKNFYLNNDNNKYILIAGKDNIHYQFSLVFNISLLYGRLFISHSLDALRISRHSVGKGQELISNDNWENRLINKIVTLDFLAKRIEIQLTQPPGYNNTLKFEVMGTVEINSQFRYIGAPRYATTSLFYFFAASILVPTLIVIIASFVIIRQRID